MAQIHAKGRLLTTVDSRDTPLNHQKAQPAVSIWLKSLP